MQTKLIGEQKILNSLSPGDIFMFDDHDRAPRIGLLTLTPTADKVGRMVTLNEPLIFQRCQIDLSFAQASVFKFSSPVLRTDIALKGLRPAISQRRIGEVAVLGSKVMWLGESAVDVENGEFMTYGQLSDAFWFAEWTIELDGDSEKPVQIIRFPTE